MPISRLTRPGTRSPTSGGRRRHGSLLPRTSGRCWFSRVSDSGTGNGPALDNVVVQPFGRDDVRIYLDQNASQAFDDGEPLMFLRRDNPHTSAVDETGTYRFTGLPDGPYSVRELLADGFRTDRSRVAGFHEVTISGSNSIQNLDFGNRWEGQIRGTKFVDWNNNGIRDRNPLPASSPSVFMVVDVSYTSGRYAGFPVPDVNADGIDNRVLDAELYAMLTLRQELVDLGWGNSSQISITVFGSEAVQIDMDPVAAGIQLFATPEADADGDGISDVEQLLRGIRRAHSGTTPGTTDFESALDAVLQTLTAQPPAGDASLFFLSDGLSNSPWSFAEEVEQLDALGVDRVAWAFGDIADVADLRRLDPFAEHLNSTDEILERVTARSRSGAGDGRWLEPGLPDVTIYLDDNRNQQLDWTDADDDGRWDPGEGEQWTVSGDNDPATTDVDETGWYVLDGLPIGVFTVREVIPPGYVQTAPLLPDEYHVDLRTGPIAAGYDFGNRPLPGGITGLKGLDADDDGEFPKSANRDRRGSRSIWI